MYPGLSHDEIIEECLKELKHHFEVGPEVALISAEKGVQCVPFDESLQKKFPYFEGTYEVFDVPHTAKSQLESSARHSTVSMKMWYCPLFPKCSKLMLCNGFALPRKESKNGEKQQGGYELCKG